jgi:hypothetical protein
MPEGKTNNPKGINQYTKGGGAAFGVPAFAGKRTFVPSPAGLQQMQKSPAGAGRGGQGGPTTKDMSAFYGDTRKSGGRGLTNPESVDPYKAQAAMGAAIGGAVERKAAIAKGAVKGIVGAAQGLTFVRPESVKSALASVREGAKMLAEGAKQGAIKAEFNFAENGAQRGARKGEAIARSAADLMQSARIAKETASDKIKSSADSLKRRMWGG